jgi:hypothetical protein
MCVRRGRDVTLQWSEAADPATLVYNVWRVSDGDKTLIPLSSARGAPANPAIQQACADLARDLASCVDPGAVDQAALCYYQVRGACEDGLEGP